MSILLSHNLLVRFGDRIIFNDYQIVLLLEQKYNTFFYLLSFDRTKAVSRFRSPEIEKHFQRLQQLREQLQMDCHEVCNVIYDHRLYIFS